MASAAASGAASGATAGSAFGPIGTVAGGILGAAGGLFGDSAAKKAAKEQRKIAEQAAVDQAFAGALDPTSIGLSGGASASFNPGAKGQGEFFPTGASNKDGQIVTDALGNLYVSKRGKAPVNMGQKATIGPDGSISLPPSVTKSKKFKTSPDQGFGKANAGLAAAAQNALPSVESNLGDLEAPRTDFVNSISGNLAAGNQVIDPTIDPGQFAQGGFMGAGGFGPGSPEFQELQAAQQFANQAGDQLPGQTTQQLQQLGQQGADVGAVGAGQFAGGPNQFANPQIQGFLNSADVARQQADQGFASAAADRTNLLRDQAAPAQQRLLDAISQSAFSKGQLGSAGGREALRTGVEQIGQQDLGFQLAGQDLGQQLQQDATGRAQGFGQTATGFGQQGTAQQLAGMQGFGTGAGLAAGTAGDIFGQNLSMSELINQRGNERFGRASNAFGQVRDAQNQAFQQGTTDRDMLLNIMRGNIAGTAAERDAAFGRGVTGANAALGFGQESRANALLPVQVATAIGNQRQGAANNMAGINAAQINNTAPNTSLADAFTGASSALIDRFAGGGN